MSSCSMKILWLNRVIYYPKDEEGETTTIFKAMIKKVIASLSPEFSSFIDDLEIRLDSCPHPKTRGHRRVNNLLTPIVQ